MIARNNIICFIIIPILFSCVGTQAQELLDRDVKAKLKVLVSENSLIVEGKALGLSKFNQSLTYELLVFSEDEKGNKNKNKQLGRFVIEPQQLKLLSKVTINVKSKKDKAIVLLLIKNVEGKILSKSRKEYVGGILVKKKQFKKITLPQNEDGVSLLAVVLERTKTTPGRNFYRYFYSEYKRYKFNDSRAIVVEEKHSRGRNTRIEIRVEHKVIYQFFVNPKDDYLKSQANYAIRSLYRFFEKKKKNYIVEY